MSAFNFSFFLNSVPCFESIFILNTLVLDIHTICKTMIITYKDSYNHKSKGQEIR